MYRIMSTKMALYTSQNTSQRAMAMVLSLASALLLSPLYLTSKTERRNSYETRFTNTGFVLPMILTGLIIAIKTTSSSSSSSMQRGCSSGSYSSGGDGGSGCSSFFPSMDSSWILRVGSSSLGLTGILVMLMFVLSWQHSVQGFFWR